MRSRGITRGCPLLRWAAIPVLDLRGAFEPIAKERMNAEGNRLAAEAIAAALPAAGGGV